MKIKSLSVKNSPFFQDTKIDFSEKLNCIMGGRGTGKTTLLYFILSSLQKNVEDTNKKCADILKRNLGSEGVITLEIEGDDGIDYSITKLLNEPPQPYILPGEYVPIEKIIADIKCDIFEAGEIEEIGRSNEDKLKLIDLKIREDVQKIEHEIHEIKIQLSKNAEDIKINRKKIQYLDDMAAQYVDVEKDFNEHKKTAPEDILDSEKKEFEEADLREKIRMDEKIFLEKNIEFIKEVSSFIESQLDKLARYREGQLFAKKDFYNTEIIDTTIGKTNDFLNIFESKIKEISEEIPDIEREINSRYIELCDVHEKQQADFIKLKQRFESNRFYIDKYNILSTKKDKYKRLQAQLIEMRNDEEEIIKTRKVLMSTLNNLKNDLFNKRLGCISELNQELSGQIKINLKSGGITSEYENILKAALAGSGLRYNELVTKIVSNFSPDEFATVINNKDIESLRSITGIDEVRGNALINVLKNSDAIFEVEAIYCPDLPEFKLKVNSGENEEENYRNSEDLSMGQRCTTVLPIIFAVSTNPLIIDQPEDNLDNKYITNDIDEIIKKQKEKRQLIFITHNPNIPVLSESENNIFLNYDKCSIIDKTGNVDDVKENIVNLLEGGEQAFQIREEKYQIDYKRKKQK